MNHGTSYAYNNGRCRCLECKRWRSRYQNLYRAHVERHGPKRYPAGRVRAHVAALVASGWTKTEIAAELGHTGQWLYSVLHNGHHATGGVKMWVRHDIAAAILAVAPLEPVDVDPVVVERLARCEDWRGVPRTDAERDAAIRAMDAAGVSRNEIARVTHLNSATLYRALRAEAVAS